MGKFNHMDEMHILYKTHKIYELLDKQPKKSVIIDIGCRGTYFLEQLYKRGFTNIHGVDYVDRTGDFTFHKLDLNYDNLPFADNSVDMINCVQVLHALENPFNTVREIKRILKPNGIFIFDVININNLQERLNFLLTGNISDIKYSGEALTYFNNVIFHKLFDDFKVMFKLYSIGNTFFVPIARALYKYRYIGKIMSMYKQIPLPRVSWLSQRTLYVTKYENSL